MAEERETKTFQKISEVRKKISLCEGKRRAFFNRTEKEKKINKEKTFILKDEVNVNIYIFRYILEVCISINPKLHQISCTITKDTIIDYILYFVDSQAVSVLEPFHEGEYFEKHPKHASSRQAAVRKGGGEYLTNCH